MRWTRQRRARDVIAGRVSRERSYGAQDERRFNAFAKISAGSTWLAEALVEVAAYGKTVWSWHPLLMPSPVEVTSAQPGSAHHRSAGRR
jgi:hypothetical protein